MDEEQAHIAAWERRLARAAKSYVERLDGEGVERHRELEATLLRLGFCPEGVGRLADNPAADANDSHADMAAALQRELAYQLRCARAARPGYDINRHIAVVRAVRCFAKLTQGPRPHAPVGRDPSPSRRAPRLR